MSGGDLAGCALSQGSLFSASISSAPLFRAPRRRIVRRARLRAVRAWIPHSSATASEGLRDAQILARHADPRTTEHYDRARGNLDRHGVHFLTAYVAGV